MSDVAIDQRLPRAQPWQSWLVAGQTHELIAPRLRAGALLRWGVVALVALVVATDPPRTPALAVAWLVIVSLYNAVGQYGGEAVTGQTALQLARGLVFADMAAVAALAAVYRGVLPEGLAVCFLLVLLEALLWCDWPKVLLSIGMLGAGWAATDLVSCLIDRRGAFPWGDFLGKLMAGSVVAAALVLALRVLSAAVADGRTADAASAEAAREALHLRLSAREKEVLALISAGCSNRMIAARLHLAPSTVKSHVESILGRLDARNRAEAVAIAARLRLPIND
jgi:DNA-binding CsgD family transcriptional regulator